jgi:hypothetical protein
MTDTSFVARVLACLAASIYVGAALASDAHAASPCSLVTKGQIAHIVGLGHVSTTPDAFGNTDECDFEAWKSGSMPRGHEFRKKLEEGSLAVVAITAATEGPEESPLTGGDAEQSNSIKSFLERRLRQRAAVFSPPAYGAEEVGGAFVKDATERTSEGVWRSVSKSKRLTVFLIHTAVKPAIAESEVSKIAAIVVPAFGL